MKAAPRLATGLGVDRRARRRRRFNPRSRRSTGWRRSRANSAPSESTRSRRAPCAKRRTRAPSWRSVQRTTGLRVRVLDGDEEARLSFRSAVAHFDMGVGRTVVVDIGGGSLELALERRGRDRASELTAVRRDSIDRRVLQRRRHAEARSQTAARGVAREFATEFRSAIGAARRSSDRAERSRTSRASTSHVRAFSRRDPFTTRTFRTRISSIFSTCSPT